MKKERTNITEIQTGLFQVGTKKFQQMIETVSYVLIDMDHAYLIGLPKQKEMEDVTAFLIAQPTPITTISCFILNTNYIDTESLLKLKHSFSKIRLYVEWRTREFLLDQGHRNIQLISKNKFIITTPSGRTLKCIKSSFVPDAGSYMIFDTKKSTLFTSDLYSAPYFSEMDPFDASKVDAVEQYHEQYFPSSDFVKAINHQIQLLNVHDIYTLTGNHYPSSAIDSLHSVVSKHEFYNTNFIVKRSPLVHRTYDYIHILNQFLHRLLSLYEAEDIRKTFESTSITLAKDTLEINDSTLRRRELYNHFFDTLYVKHGVEWINVLESSVNRIARLYYIPKPDIYKARTIELHDAISALQEENTQLLNLSDILKQEMKDTRDLLLKCPLTGLYNQDFFVEFLRQHQMQVSGVLLLEIDGMDQLNRKYSIEAGDEIILSLAYLIKNTIQDKGLVFRSDGAGFYIYLEKMTSSEVYDIAEHLRTTIIDSTLFIETITAGIGIMYRNEITKENILEFETTVFQQLYQRLQRAHQLGANQIVDEIVKGDTQYVHAILLVDDDVYNIGVIQRICERLQLKFYQVNSVQDALLVLTSHPISMIISEISLSKLDAFHLKDQLNQMVQTSTIPFVVVSHNKTKDTIIKANANHIDYVISKPFHPEELIGLIKRMVLS